MILWGDVTINSRWEILFRTRPLEMTKLIVSEFEDPQGEMTIA